MVLSTTFQKYEIIVVYNRLQPIVHVFYAHNNLPCAKKLLSDKSFYCNSDLKVKFST